MINHVFYLSHNYGAYIALLAMLYWSATTIFMIRQNREPAITVSWVLLFILLPVIAPLLYYVFGRNWPESAQKSNRYGPNMKTCQWSKCGCDNCLPPHMENLTNHSIQTFTKKIITALHTNGQGPVLPGRNLRIFSNGTQKFTSLITDIQNANDTIHMQYFIWGKDALTAHITALLNNKLHEGIKLRILNDYIGCLRYPKNELKSLALAGADIAYDITQLSMANYRDHRKIVVIDGTIAYTGGMNMAQEYIDGKPRFQSWRDTHVRFEGPLASALQHRFAERWYEVMKQDLFTNRNFPPHGAELPGDFYGQVVSQEVQDSLHLAKRAHQIAITGASTRVRIQSPYFVPDEGTMDALIATALGGVELQLMMTGIPDKKIPFMAAKTYWKPLIEAGGHVYLYTKGFMHAKTLTVDGEATAIGTLNLDVRGLKLHKELMLWMYDSKITALQDALFEEDLTQCHEVTTHEIDSLGNWSKLASSSARLASHIL